ncbi:response regulator [Geomesophilobacter sediminis]|uniref:Response regulator n=1 Tax=Geomesophilobacter sediminis TaxID=2798584 RepID=A0A8J7S8V0_9BACT|nr:response regulator [Geomesophilobacter sediminis]MBJ6727822.1 response regulator [Geomesophilobacter sediminis]
MHKVLLVDDVSMFVELQRSYLEPSDLKILTAYNGLEALEVCRSERPELVFMDLHMPVMDGAAVCAAVKKDPNLADTRIVMITSETKTGDHSVCYNAGCDDLLTKPLDRKIFLETARRFLPKVERRNRRVGCRIRAAYRASGTSHSGLIMDVSREGLYLSTNCAVEEGTQLDLVFALPEPHTAIIQTRGEVAWINFPEDRKKPSLPQGFGLRIVKIDPESSASLARFVEQPSPFIEPIWKAS